MIAHEVVTEPAELERHTAAWERLLDASATCEPTLSPLWMLAWWRVFGPRDGRRLMAILLREGGRLVGLAPLVRRRRWYRRAIPLRSVELLASGEDEADETCSDYLGVLAERGAEQRVARALVRVLTTTWCSAWDELVLTAMNGDAAMPGLLAEAFRQAGLGVASRTISQAPYIRLPQSWDAYLAALPGRRRYLVRRSLRDFERWAGGGAELCRAATPAELERGKRILRDLHQSRWAAQGRPGVFASPLFSRFHDAVMGELFARDALDLWWLGKGGEPIAALYNVVWDGRVYYYQAGRQPDLPRSVRPGIVLHAHAIRQAIEAHRTEYDFLGGASRYKSQLATARRPLVELRVMAGTLRAKARSATARAVGLARRVRAARRRR